MRVNKNWRCIIQFEYSLNLILERNFDLAALFSVYISRLYVSNPKSVCFIFIQSINHLLLLPSRVFFRSNLKYFNTSLFCYLDQFMHAERGCKIKSKHKSLSFPFPFRKRNKTKQKLFFPRKKNSLKR